MGWTRNDDGSEKFEIDRLGETLRKDPTEVKYSGEIKGINLPISFPIKEYKKNKEHEICCYFSALESEKDDSKEISKELTFLSKHGKYTPFTHLIPMSVKKIAKRESSFFGVDVSRLKFGMSSGELAATATLQESMQFFPCYEGVLPMMLNHFNYPSFFISLLPETLRLNVKAQANTYRGVPLQNVSAKCCDGTGHSHIHIVSEKISRIWLFEQIEWSKLEFENEDFVCSSY